jgi:alcohol dehydrogenase class IV
LNFEFASSARIVFGQGTICQAGKIALAFGRKGLIVTGRDIQRASSLKQSLETTGIDIALFSVPSEPSTDLVTEGAKLARNFGAEFVLGFGGGSAMDAGKAIAALATNSDDVFHYLEVVGKGNPLGATPLPVIAIPTTAGTGAEVTRNAVISVPELQTKASLRSASLLPRAAIVDPELTHALPPHLTAATGLDALTQLIEPFVCARPNPLTDALCKDGMGRCARSLRTAFARGDNSQAREDMALASLFGGLALANSGLGAVHGFAAAIGGMFPIAHGAICAALLPHVWRANVEAATREKRNDLLDRFAEAARILAGGETTPQQGGDWLEELIIDLKISTLSATGVTRAQFPAICERARSASSMKANPVALSDEELMGILEASF